MIESLSEWWGDLDEMERAMWVMAGTYAVAMIIMSVVKLSEAVGA